MQVLDVLPWETALQRLLRAGVCSDEQLFDYHLSQALRSLTYAVNRTSLAVPGVVSFSDTSTTATGGAVVLFQLCTCSLKSELSLRTAVYVSTRLLCDESTAFGEGNERPCCTTAWSEALCSSAISKTFLHEQMNVHRRLTLGFLFILSGTVRAVVRGCVAGKRLTSHFAEFVQQLLDDVIPYVAAMADVRDDITITTHLDADSIDDPSEKTKDAFQAPSRLTVEANNTLVHFFYNIALDIVEVHHNCEKKKTIGSRTVLDRGLPLRMWPAVSILRNALLRTLDWIRKETIWRIRSVGSPNVEKEIQATTESLTVLKDSVEVLFAQLLRKQESLECSRRAIEQQFGPNAKDYHVISEMMWANTLRLCFLCRSVTNACIQIHGGAGDTEVQQTEKQVLALIASLVTSVPSLDEGEKEHTVFLATTSLLSATFAAVLMAPAPSMQVTLWSADNKLTQDIHNAIIQRALRYRDENVEKLSALLSRLILYSSLNTSAGRVIADSSDQLLELLADGRDSTSQCVTGMLVRATVERPHTILPSLFSLLQRGDTNTRRNVLDVLSALPQVCEGSSYGEAFTSEQMRPVLRLLSEELLLRIQDEELLVRLQSSKLFTKVWPEDVCRPLLSLATKRDPSVKKQSAAQQALYSVVDAHMGNSSVVLLILQESLALLGEGAPSIRYTPSTPADILAFATLHSSVVDDTSEVLHEQSASIVKEGKASERLIRLFLFLVRRWAEGVSKWTEVLIAPFLQRVMKARGAMEQDLVVRMMMQIANVCSETNDGVVALLSNCLCIMNPREEEGAPCSGLWLDNNNINNDNDNDGNVALVDTVENNKDMSNTTFAPVHGSNVLAYQTVAPLLCFRGCLRRVFLSYTTTSELPLPMAKMWNLLWCILFTSRYREMFSLDAQRLLLELVCKYSVSMILNHLGDLELKYIRRNILSDDDRRTAYFVCRVGFFCIGYLLLGNRASFRREITDSSAVSNVDDNDEKELSSLVGGAAMVGEWIENLVMPWLLAEENLRLGADAVDADSQRLSQGAVECLALLVIVALNHKAFDDAVVARVMRPLTQLATLCREKVSSLKEDPKVVGIPVEWNVSTEVLGQFEFAIQVQRRALNLLRTHPLGKMMICLWFEKYMPLFIALANASCIATSRLGKKDIAQVTVECCHVLFLAVMASGNVSPTSSHSETPSPKGQQLQQQQQLTQGESGKATLMSLDATDRNALITFAVGSARYSTLPQVQSEGVKLLSALLGAAPDIFVDESSTNETVLGDAFAVLESVALLHPDARTRTLAEQVLEAIRTQ